MVNFKTSFFYLILFIVALNLNKCGDNCDFKFQEAFTIILDSTYDKNLIKTTVLTRNGDNINSNNSKIINIYNNKNNKVCIFIISIPEIIDVKVVIEYLKKTSILKIFRIISVCKPNLISNSRDYIEFKSF